MCLPQGQVKRTSKQGVSPATETFHNDEGAVLQEASPQCGCPARPSCVRDAEPDRLGPGSGDSSPTRRSQRRLGSWQNGAEVQEDCAHPGTRPGSSTHTLACTATRSRATPPRLSSCLHAGHTTSRPKPGPQTLPTRGNSTAPLTQGSNPTRGGSRRFQWNKNSPCGRGALRAANTSVRRRRDLKGKTRGFTF